MKYFILSILTLFTITLNSCSKKSNLEPDQTKGEPTGNNTTIHDKTFIGIGGTGFAAALQTDGKIVLAGSFGSNSNYTYSINRFNKDGGVDNTFNIDVDKSWKINGFSALAILSDGKILIGGDFTVGGTRKILLKLNANGALDNSFTSPNFNSIGSTLPTIRKIIDLGSDRILIAGKFNTFTASPRVDFNNLIKITYGGLLDNSYQSNLLVTSYPTDILPLNDGKLLVSGTLNWSNGQSFKPYIARLNANGSQDATFHFKEILNDRNSSITVKGNGSITSLALQTDGKIIIGGDFLNIENTAVRDGVYNYAQLARLNNDGSIDFNFKSPAGYRTDITDLEILSDNRIVAARGTSPLVSGLVEYLRLYSKDGEVDGSFNLGYNDSYIQQIIKQSDGKYLLIGGFKDPSNQAILRVSIK